VEGEGLGAVDAAATRENAMAAFAESWRRLYTPKEAKLTTARGPRDGVSPRVGGR
jgi:hypothetical protein